MSNIHHIKVLSLVEQVVNKEYKYAEEERNKPSKSDL
jgi:hypothetical protein